MERRQTPPLFVMNSTMKRACSEVGLTFTVCRTADTHRASRTESVITRFACRGSRADDEPRHRGRPVLNSGNRAKPYSPLAPWMTRTVQRTSGRSGSRVQDAMAGESQTPSASFDVAARFLGAFDSVPGQSFTISHA